jgi:diadenosine tetraphosphate (Ap4A) HIT family hydrolase
LDGLSSLTIVLSSIQEVDHVHFHIIPKPSESDSEGLVVGWPAQKPSMEDLKALQEELKGKL